MAQDKVTLNVAKDNVNKKDKYEVVYIQGKRYQIEKGKYVEVNPIVREVIETATMYNEKGNTQERDLALEG
jgi:hypothetical protein